MDPASKPERHLSIVELEAPSVRARAEAPSDGRDSLERLAEHLHELGKDPSVEQTLEIGRLVIEHLYAGELGRWRDRGPKTHSLRALASRAGLPVSSSALYRAIALYELSERLGGVERWTRAGLGVSHLRLVLGLAHDTQRRLLDLAVARRWTVAELEREAAACRRDGPRRGSRGGRPRTPRFAKTVQRLAKLSAATDEMFGDLDAVADMDAERVDELQATLALIRTRCDELAARIEQVNSTG